MDDSSHIVHGDPGTQPRPHGLIVLDKPPGPTSYDCIRFLRRTCGLPRKWKVGHLGTLDPFASGVLVVALGQAVRYAQYALRSSKKYRARLWLGEETDTLDPTGNVIAAQPVPDNWTGLLPGIAADFTGRMEQIPPAYSAKQIEGKRSYKAARKGEKIELNPVTVEVKSLEFGETTECSVDFVTEVSGGTYVRALGRDIAKALGTLGYLVGLERLRAGPFGIDESIPLKAFEVGGATVLEHHLRPVDEILLDLPICAVRPGLEDKILHGQKLDEEDMDGEFPDSAGSLNTVRIVDSEGRFRALGRIRENPPGVVPFKPWIV